MQFFQDCWDEGYSPENTLELLRERALDHASKGGPVGASIRELLLSHDYGALIRFELDLDRNDWNISHLIHCRQALAFFTKLEPLDIGIDKKQVALTKFLESERKCRDFNNELRSWRRGQLSLLPRVVRLLSQARRKVRRVMGRCPDLTELSLQFGPGATTEIKRKDSCAQTKFASGFQCSSGLLASGLLPGLLREMPGWLAAIADLNGCPIFSDITMLDEGVAYETVSVPVDVVPGRLEFVPKNAKTHRSIIVEPNLNGLLQSGIGRHLERRLRIHGLDIRDQTRNADLARRGSLDGDLATLDLSSASDLISFELVRELVSDEWWGLLLAARSGTVEHSGTTHRLQKFSSMGNGFTFPLETLIFWAISTSANDPAPAECDVGVYGDDIIVPVEGVDKVIWALQTCGFEVNSSKSYWSGPFRESCGKDFYKGINTRPYYQKHLVSPATLFTLHNFYYRLGCYEEAGAVHDLISPSLRLYGPDGYGDGHLLSEEWPVIRKRSWLARGFGGSAFETFTLKGRRSISRYPGDYVSPLYSVYVKDRAPVHDLFCGLNESSPIMFEKDGRPSWVVPGTQGYKRVLIYTLA